jgi:hypothetical protein
MDNHQVSLSTDINFILTEIENIHPPEELGFSLKISSHFSQHFPFKF